MLGFGAIGEYAIGEVGPDAVPLTSEILQRVITRLVDIEQILPALPKRLHHFTALGTAAQIIENDNVRLSNAEYSNDQTEMEQAKGLIITALNARVPDPFFDQVIQEYQKRAPDLEAYIFCMSSDQQSGGATQDILSQWRAYGQDGRGIAITLDTRQVSRLVQNVPSLRINPVMYDVIVQQKFIDGLLIEGQAAFANRDPRALDATVSALAYCTPLMKARGFVEESEWRLIFMPPAEPSARLGFHPRRDFLAPYLDLDYIWHTLRPEMLKIQSLNDALPTQRPQVSLPLLSIDELMVGPSGHQTLNVRAFRKLLAQCNRGSVIIRQSKIPYRSLG